MIALCVSGCSTSREATVRSSAELRTTEVRTDTVREQVLVAVHDTIMEVTTITIRENEQGDTIRMNTVTGRERVRDRAAVKDKEEKVVVKTDTVFVAVRDSTFVKNTNGTNGTNRASPFANILKWIFAIVIGLIVLMIVFKVKF